MPPDNNQQPPSAEPPPENEIYFPGVDPPPKRPPITLEVPAAEETVFAGVDAVPLEQQPPEAVQQPPTNPTYVYAGIGVGLGVLVALALAVILWNGSRQIQQNDWPAVVSAEDGVRGHLLTKWEDKPEYRLSIEPNDPAQSTGFAFAVAHSPRPISFDLQLKDSLGFVVCSTNIVLKYDPKVSTNPASSVSAHPGGKNAEERSISDQVEAGLDLAKMEATELERERGRDIFQNALGTNGQVSSISSQGDFQCSKKAYESASSWGFSSNFPSSDEQAQLLRGPAEGDAGGSNSPAQRASARRSSRLRPGDVATPFYTEGDDMIVAYDASTGVIETVAGRTSFIDKAGKFANAIKGRDFPIEIHYRCDQSGLCTLSGAGATGLQVRLRR